MYPIDTIRVGDSADTIRTIGAMGEWFDRAKVRMAAVGVTQEQLMPLFGVTTRGAVGHYLSGRRDPSSTVLVKLADRLSMSLDELLRGQSQPVSLAPEILAAAFTMARKTAAKTEGDDDVEFDPSVLHDAAMVAESLYEITAGKTSTKPEKAHKKFDRERREDGKRTRTGKTGGTGSTTGTAKVGQKAKPASGKARKSG